MHCYESMHDAYDWMAFPFFLVQADVVFFSSESGANISPCI